MFCSLVYCKSPLIDFVHEIRAILICLLGKAGSEDKFLPHIGSRAWEHCNPEDKQLYIPKLSAKISSHKKKTVVNFKTFM